MENLCLYLYNWHNKLEQGEQMLASREDLSNILRVSVMAISVSWFVVAQFCDVFIHKYANTCSFSDFDIGTKCQACCQFRICCNNFPYGLQPTIVRGETQK